MDNFLKVVSAEINNFQSLEHKQLEFGGKSIAIIGKNGGGKSSLMRAIQSTLDPKMRVQIPIKDGEERADVKIQVQGNRKGQPVEYTYHVVYNQNKKAGKVKVTDADGNEVGAKDIQRDLIGNISFDIDKFIRLGLTPEDKISKPGIQEQVEMFMQFLTDEQQKYILEIDHNYEKMEEQRKADKKEVAKLKTLIKQIQMDEMEMEKYEEDKTDLKKTIQTKISKIGEEMKLWNANNREMEKLKESLTKFKENFAEAKVIDAIHKGDSFDILTKLLDDLKGDYPFKDGMAVMNAEMMSYLELYETEKKGFQEGKKRFLELKEFFEKNPEEPTVDNLSQELDAINQHEDMRRKVLQIKERWLEVRKLEEGIDKMTENMKKLKAERKKVFADSNMPVKGLEFDDKEGITYNGLPFNQNHIETSMIIAIGVKIAMGLNPNLRTIFIKDGSMFDKKTLTWLLKQVEKNDYQLFIEMVDWTGEKEVEVQFTEDFITQ